MCEADAPPGLALAPRANVATGAIARATARIVDEIKGFIIHLLGKLPRDWQHPKAQRSH
jgi:hypothetical protein